MTRFVVQGTSGGGPYALACPVLMPDHIQAVVLTAALDRDMAEAVRQGAAGWWLNGQSFGRPFDAPAPAARCAGRGVRLRGLARDHFVGRVTCYLGEVNAVHPFREGNGRTQRAFFEQLAADAGYTLAWQRLDAGRNISASDAIMRGDPEPMRKMPDELIDSH